MNAYLVRAAMAATLLACTFQASAQSALPTPQELNPGLRLPATPGISTAKGDILTKGEGGPCPLRENTQLSFVLTSVSFDGADKVPAEDFAPAYSEYLNRKIPVATICDIRDRAASILFNKGILARVEIPEQRIAQGALRLEVIEAFVEKVEVTGDLGPASGKVAEYVNRLRGMKPFDINLAQRYLFLAGDVPGVRIAANIKRAPAGRGAVILEIHVTRDHPVRAVLNVQNTGANETGPWGALARVDFNGFTGLGEKTSLVGFTSFQPEEQKVIQAIEEVRLGSDGLLGRLSVSWGVAHPGSSVKTLDLRSHSLVTGFDLVYPLVRERRSNLNLTGGFEVIEQSMDIAGDYPLTRDHLRVLHVGADGDVFWPGETPVWLRAAGDLRQGLPAFGASKKGALFASHRQGLPDATVLRGNADLTVGWQPHFSTTTRLSAQLATHPLLAYEEMYAGNLTIGRGYDPSIISGDRGIAAAFEAKLGPYNLAPGFSTSAMAFFDVANLANSDTGGINTTVKSTGFGLSLQISDWAHLDATYAHPLDRISPLAARRPPDKVLLSLTFGY